MCVGVHGMQITRSEHEAWWRVSMSWPPGRRRQLYSHWIYALRRGPPPELIRNPGSRLQEVGNKLTESGEIGLLTKGCYRDRTCDPIRMVPHRSRNAIRDDLVLAIIGCPALHSDIIEAIEECFFRSDRRGGESREGRICDDGIALFWVEVGKDRFAHASCVNNDESADKGIEADGLHWFDLVHIHDAVHQRDRKLNRMAKSFAQIHNVGVHDCA